MLKYHIDGIEKTLINESERLAATGHPIHKGTPKEIFIREFLNDHISEQIGIGTGNFFIFFSFSLSYPIIPNKHCR